MKCCINYQNHQTINNTMKKIFTFVLIVCTIQNMFAQAVGYQGKKFTIEVGYSPVTTLTARYFDFNLSDAHYLNESPILVKHIPKIGVEYVVLNRGSLMLRYNRWNFTTNLEYFDNANFETHLAGANSKGNMITLGYKSFLTATPAPLGSYFGIYTTHYSYSSEYTDSEFDQLSIPNEISSYELDNAQAVGFFGSLGFKNILWDQFTLDVSLEAGIFLPLGESTTNFFGDEFGGNYTFVIGETPQREHIKNTNVFFTVVPTVSFGWLAF